MRNRLTKRIFVLSLAALLMSPVIALANEFIFSRLSINDGLRSNFVNCVWQDAKGFIWVGTEGGLQRYDGNKFIQIYAETRRSLPSLPVQQIIGDKKNNMWLKMGSMVGWYNFRSNTFIKSDLSQLPDGDRTLTVDKKGNVMIVALGYGVYRYNPANNRFEPWTALGIPRDWGVQSLCEDLANGNYWISGNGGLGLYDQHSGQFYHEGYNPRNLPVFKLKLSRYMVKTFIDSRRRFWLLKWIPGYAANLYCYEEASGKLTELNVQPELAGYFSMADIKEFDQMIWLSGGNIFNLFDEHARRFYRFYDSKDINYGIKFFDIRQVFRDADQNIWVATDNGLYSTTLLNRRIRHGTLPTDNTDLNFIKQLQNGKLLLGTWGQKVFPFDVSEPGLAMSADSVLRQALYHKCPDNTNFWATWSVAEYSLNHHIFIGCQAGYLVDYDPVTRKSVFTGDTAFKSATIRSIAEDRQHNLWFGTQFGGLVKRTIDGRYHLIGNFTRQVLKLLIDDHGLIWMATGGNGLLVFDPQQNAIIKRYTASVSRAEGLSTNFIQDIARMNADTMIVACSENLDILNIKTGKVHRFTGYNGLPMPIVNCLQFDKRGQLWMATNGGIVRYSFRNNSFRAYDQKDGLITTSDSKNALYRAELLRNGELVFGGGNSFVIFDPEALHDSEVPKDVSLTDIRLFNRDLNVDSITANGGLELRHDQNAITIQFASLSYTQRDQLTYYYQLQGAGKNWIRAEHSLTASYASLAPGHYMFRVKCLSSDGVPAPHTTSLNIFIRPAYWQTWWFMVLLALLAAVPVYIMYRLRINRLLAVQKLREKVARDLHDDMGSTLTSIHILSEMAGARIVGDQPQVKDYLSRISTNSSQMMEAMDDIVWSVNPANDSMPRIIARMREYAAAILEPRDINYAVINDDQLEKIKLDMEVRRNLFLIYKESLNNMVKYAQADMVRIEFRVSKDSLQLVIADNGLGFDLEQKSEGNGLVNMRKRARGMKGVLEIFSKKNEGTSISLTIPLT